MTYRLVERGGILCMVCGLVSYHPEDVAHRYCGNCHAFHEDVPPDAGLRQDELTVLALVAHMLASGRHAYMSTYCMHLRHADCRRSCKVCKAPCICECHKLKRPEKSWRRWWSRIREAFSRKRAA